MRFVFFLVFVALSACATTQTELFESGTGEVLACEHYEQAECGMTLSECGDAKTAQFECMTGLRYVGPAALQEKKPAAPTVPADYAPAAQDDFTTPTEEK